MIKGTILLEKGNDLELYGCNNVVSGHTKQKLTTTERKCQIHYIGKRF